MDLIEVPYDKLVCIVDLSLCIDMLWTWVCVLKFVNWVLLICFGFEFQYILICSVYEFVDWYVEIVIGLGLWIKYVEIEIEIYGDW